MVKVTIADVLQEEHNGTQVYVVVLLDEAGHRLLPIWVGKWEGESIAIGLRGHDRPRPLTYKFMANLLEAVGASLESVRLEAIKEGTFYAVVKLKSGDRVQEVDARPSDAIALAVYLDSPIYAALEVLEQGGFDVPAEEVEKRQLGQGLDSWMRDMEKQWMNQQKQQKAKLPLTEEEMKEAHQKLMTLMFASESD